MPTIRVQCISKDVLSFCCNQFQPPITVCDIQSSQPNMIMIIVSPIVHGFNCLVVVVTMANNHPIIMSYLDTSFSPWAVIQPPPLVPQPYRALRNLCDLLAGRSTGLRGCNSPIFLKLLMDGLPSIKKYKYWGYPIFSMINHPSRFLLYDLGYPILRSPAGDDNQQ